MSEGDRLREKLDKLDAEIQAKRTELEKTAKFYAELSVAVRKLLEHKSDCLKKIAEVHALELLRNGDGE